MQRLYTSSFARRFQFRSMMHSTYNAARMETVRAGADASDYSTVGPAKTTLTPPLPPSSPFACVTVPPSHTPAPLSSPFKYGSRACSVSF